MNEITGVLVDGHVFDIKNDMVNGCYFPNSLFPGATFKMVIDNDPANNGKVTWQCGSSKGNNLVAVSGDGTVTFPDADERCCDTLFYINATDTSGRIISSYLFVVKRFF
ncbi:Ig-like domain-containing protein [Escherichia sp. E2748]|uniref:Ig-like domain-containing protein n=2 Tax=Escherichia sp. E2748 TaxID=2044460 RepID=UPI001F1143C3|nr:Ig-like domain-containing protein [Escherichia sp. E2748]